MIETVTAPSSPRTPDAAGSPAPAPSSAESAPTPLPPAGTGPVRAVLLDADGVLQLIGTPWKRALAEGGGQEFAERLLVEEYPALEGRESLHDVLRRLVTSLRLPVTAEDLAQLWWRATPDPTARAVVTELRQAGYLTVLATNQQRERMAWMRTALSYDGLCDINAYSCLLGVAKPAPEYFRRVLALAGVQPAQALFVDDNAENIATARHLGLATIHHPVDAGGAVLRAELAQALAG